MRLADLRPFAEEPGQPFFFDDVQAACDFALAEGRLTVNMLRASGLLERLPVRGWAKPNYLLTGEGVALVRAPAAAVFTAGSSGLPSLRLQEWMVTYNAVGLPLKAVSVSMLVPAFPISAAPEAEALVLVQTRKAVAGELLRLRGELAQALGMEVGLALAWWV